MSFGLTYRLFIAGELVDEAHCDTPSAAMVASDRHLTMIEATTLPWQIEVHNPDVPEDRAYLRFGTDPMGMREPAPAADLTAEVNDILTERWGLPPL